MMENYMEQKNTYEDAKKLFKHYSIHDEPALWQSFTVGLVAKNFIPGDRILTLKVCELLNDGNPLQGEIIAFITNFALDAESNLKSNKAPTLLLPENNALAKERLYALSQSAYGLSLGLSCDLQGFDKIKDADLKEDMQTLLQINSLDTDSEDFDEGDFDNVKSFMSELALRFYKKQPAVLTVKA